MVFSVLRLFVEHLQPLAKDRFIPAACLNLYKVEQVFYAERSLHIELIASSLVSKER